MGNNGAKKSCFGSIDFFGQNSLNFCQKGGVSGAKTSSQRAHETKKSSLAPVNVEFCILCSSANLFGSYVGLLTL